MRGNTLPHRPNQPSDLVIFISFSVIKNTLNRKNYAFKDFWFIVYENLELTVPEPSLFEEEDESVRPVTSTQLPNAEKSVKFNLTEIEKKSRRSEPVNFHSQSMPVQV